MGWLVWTMRAYSVLSASVMTELAFVIVSRRMVPEAGGRKKSGREL